MRTHLRRLLTMHQEQAPKSEIWKIISHLLDHFCEGAALAEPRTVGKDGHGAKPTLALMACTADTLNI